MKVVLTKSLPHGTIPFEQVRDPQTRDALMKINENIRALEKRQRTAEAALRELQRRA